MSQQQKRHLVSQQLINEMFKIAGHSITYNDVKDDTSEWYLKYTMTEEQNAAWRDFGVKLIKKKLRLTNKMAEAEMAMFDLCFGLRIQNQEDGNI